VTLELLNPDRLPTSPAYTQVVVAAGGRTVFVSGQVAAGAREDDDFAAQARAVHANLAIALEAAGARPSNVAKLTTYVVDYRSELLPAIGEARAALFGEHRPASTLVGVAALARPEFKIEVEAIAVVEGRATSASSR
jgi:enamine deaminase RidA (YjgF/YER057c/UK114 family)